MKIAICLSGQARFFDRNPTHHLLFPNHEVDYFCYFWDYCLDPGDQEKIEAAFSPKSLSIRPYPDFQPYIDRVVESGIRTWNTFPMWFAVSEADKLRQRYEKQHEFKYDAVVRSRTDNLFNPSNGSWEAALDGLHEMDLVLPTKYHFADWENKPGYNDQLALGTSRSMSIYCGMFDWFDEAFNLYPGYWGIERLLLLYLERYNQTHTKKINVKMVDVDYKLYRKVDEHLPYDEKMGYMNPALPGIR